MITKTLKDLFEVYRPKAGDEQKFVDKHVTIKHQDRNGNGDDVFKGNTKYIKRKKDRHGYDVGDDEAVYEEVEALDETPGVISKDHLENHIASADAVKKTKDGHYRFGRGFFYRSSTPEAHANQISKELTKAGIKHTVLKHGIRNFQPFRAKASIWAQNHYWADVKLHDNKIGVHEGFESTPDENIILEELIAAGNTNNKTFEEATHAHIAVMKQKDLIESILEDNSLTPIERQLQFNEAEKKLVELDAVRDATVIAHINYVPDLTEGFQVGDMVNVTNPKASPRFKIVGKTNTHYKIEHPDHGSILLLPKERIARVNKKAWELRKSAVNEAVTVTKHKYSWGKMFNVHDGNHQSFILHPEHQANIRALNKGDKTSFTDETGKKIHAERTGSLVHLKKDKANRTVSVGYHHFIEETLDELSRGSLGSYAKKAQDNVARFIDHGKELSKLAGDSARLGERDAAVHYIKMATNSYRKATNRSFGSKQAINKLTKEDIINHTINKYIPEETEQLTPEEYIVSVMEDYSENHIHAILELFDSLNKTNQLTMLENLKIENGINNLLDFVIEARGGA